MENQDMEEQQGSSIELEQQNAGTTSEHRPISTDELKGSEALLLPPGFWFCPEDSELILFYLNRKIRRESLPILDLIREVQFYKNDPEELTRTRNVCTRDEWYFFTQRERISENKFKRGTGFGTWTATSREKKVVVGNDRLIGYWRLLAYYRKGKRTEWMMKEYSSTLESQRPVKSDAKRTETVICRVFLRKGARGTGTIPSP